MEAGRITLEDVAFGLRDTVAAVHHAYLPLAEAKGLAFVLSVADEVPAAVRGDPLRVRQILTNFVANAIKFTERGSVRIGPACAAARSALRCDDTGPGHLRRHAAAPVHAFSRADDSITRRYGGTGWACRSAASWPR